MTGDHGRWLSRGSGRAHDPAHPRSGCWPPGGLRRTTKVSAPWGNVFGVIAGLIVALVFIAQVRTNKN
uniref:Uncharacterized protein n=1 Tax=Streptomyces sp. NBC_00008 TaxID=2903610 RepID=A0AAU2VNF8_9ACTN